MLIDRHLPAYDAAEARHLVVDAHIEKVHDAIGAAQIHDPAIRFLFTLSRLPQRVMARARGVEPLPLPETPTMKDVAWREDMVVLDEMPGEELVNGLIVEVRRWRLPRNHRVPASDFERFDTPRHVKVVDAFSMRPYGDGRTLLTHEVRALATDDATRKLLKTTWPVSLPVMRALMDRTLRIVKDTAEGPPRAPEPTGEAHPTVPPPERPP